MKSIFKKLSLSAAILFSAASAFSLPGVKYSIPDASGQYVYYQDNTFSRESYVGIIYYDESTYALRYVAPRLIAGSDSLPKLEMQVFITIDPSKSNVEFTGERVEPYPRSQEETDLINYLHDFMYEMTSRRQKAGEISAEKTEFQNYPQFGGEVTMKYDPAVPITNLRKINTGIKTSLELVTAGQLISSDDTSFTDFEGIPPILADKSSSVKVRKVKAKEYTVENENQKISVMLDQKWIPEAENFWLYGDSAVLVINSLENLKADSISSFKRRILLGTDHTYPDWRELNTKDENGTYTANQLFYNDLTQCFSNDIKIIKNTAKGAPVMFTLTVYSKAYKDNKKYFNSVVESFKIK